MPKMCNLYRRPRSQQWKKPPTGSRNPDSLQVDLFAFAAALLAQPRAAPASAAALAWAPARAGTNAADAAAAFAQPRSAPATRVRILDHFSFFSAVLALLRCKHLVNAPSDGRYQHRSKGVELELVFGGADSAKQPGDPTLCGGVQEATSDCKVLD